MAGYDYRKAIHQSIPGIKVLDDQPLLIEKVGGKPVLRDMPESAKTAKVPDHLKAEWQLINDGLKAVDNEQENNGDCIILFNNRFSHFYFLFFISHYFNSHLFIPFNSFPTWLWNE